MKYDIKNLIDNIKAQREAKGYSARELSIRAGLSPGFVANLEHGVYRDISIGTLYALSQELRIDSGDLLDF